MFRSLGVPLDLARFRPEGITIHPRQMLTILDGSAQTLNASTSALLSFDSSKSSASKFGSFGTDIVLGAGEPLLIESLGILVVADDTSGKLQLQSLTALMGSPTNGSIVLPLDSLSALPYTMPPVALGGFYCTMSIPRFAFYHNENVSNPLAVLAQGVLTNTDAGASHTYLRGMALAYRIISGVDANTSLELPMDK